MFFVERLQQKKSALASALQLNFAVHTYPKKWNKKSTCGLIGKKLGKCSKCNQSDVQKVSLGLITYPQRHPFQRMKRFAKDRRWKTMKAVNYLSVDN